MAGNVPSSGIARPALLDGSSPSGSRGKAKPCREVFYVICGFSAHCAPDTPSALCHSWRRSAQGAPVAAAPCTPGSGQQHRCAVPSTFPAGFGSGRGSVRAKHGPQPASMRAAPACRERLSDAEAATAAVSVALVGKLTAG
ncbi:hypothetical protein J4734_07405 [Klebsiella pneumoniae]|uniref:Uncharacterized protein n=1 Tax=Klebsiella pneumoniae TaxID=573 RepID=A0A939NS67_KLEPN|nr:hypothetical protein [Klebsiella pneumoniae]